MTVLELWERLRANGLVEGDLPDEGQPASPWYVRVMLGIAGWIGAMFLLGFVGAGLAFIIDSSAAALMLGAGCCAAAGVLFRNFEGQDFSAQFALALSLAGQGLMIIGLGQVLKAEDPPLYFAVAGMEAGLALAVPNFLHRVLAAAGAAVALALAVVQLSLHGLAAPVLCAGLALIWLDPGRWGGGGRLWRPIGYGLVLALLMVETFRLLGAQSLFDTGTNNSAGMSIYGPWIGRGLTAAVLLAVAVLLCLREGFAASSRITLAAAGAALVVGAVSLNAPGLASALLILLLGFAAGNRILMALGVLSLLGFVGHYYYSLQATLLAKSGLLAVTGLCLLAAYFVLRRGAFRAEEPGHA